MFITLAEELHFGHAAERLGLTASRVSQVIHCLERRLGGRLFDRTSRSVRLTPTGEHFLAELRSAYDMLEAVLVTAADTTAASGAATLTVGVTMSTEVPALSRLVRRFESRHPGCQVALREVDVWNPYRSLSNHEVDVLVNWLAVDEVDLRSGPPICHYTRVLAVARHHRLATRPAVCLEDLAGESVVQPPDTFPVALSAAILPPATPSGRPIRRKWISRSLTEIIAQIALGTIVHPTMALSVFARDDVALVPIQDLPPIPLGPIWLASAKHPLIRSFADLAHANAPSPETQPTPPLITANRDALDQGDARNIGQPAIAGRADASTRTHRRQDNLHAPTALTRPASPRVW